MFKIGDKFIIEIESVDTDDYGKPSYKIKGFQKLHMSEFKLRSLERLTDKDHVLEVGDIVTHVNADGKYMIIKIEQESYGTLYTIMSLDGSSVSNAIFESELEFTGDHVDIAEMLSQYR